MAGMSTKKRRRERSEEKGWGGGGGNVREELSESMAFLTYCLSTLFFHLLLLVH